MSAIRVRVTRGSYVDLFFSGMDCTITLVKDGCTLVTKQASLLEIEDKYLAFFFQSEVASLVYATIGEYVRTPKNFPTDVRHLVC